MKRLTVNRVASASLRARPRAYRSLALGVLLAVFLAATVSLCANGVMRARELEQQKKLGRMDCLLYDEPEVTDQVLRQSGLFAQIGHVTVTAQAEGGAAVLGYADGTGEALSCRACLEGRLPERAGEIALERSALEKLRLEAAVGEEITLCLAPFNGAEEERRFTLVGLLYEQAASLSGGNYYNTERPDQISLWPSALISPEEPAFATGRPVIHRVMTLAPLMSYSRAEDHHSLKGRNFQAVNHALGLVQGWDPAWDEAKESLNQTTFLWLLGGALLLSTGVATASAMESVLAGRTEEIGLLRAVGATRRQIRRIFGREPWLLALATLPAGLALGCLAAWLLSLLRPDALAFAPEPWLLLPALAVSALCIFLSSALPLRRASRQTPLGVLRDTALLRRAKSFQSKKAFRPSRLIAARQLRLHPLRQTGAALMAALTLFCSAMLGEFTAGWLTEDNRLPADYYLYPQTGSTSGGFTSCSFSCRDRTYVLTERDMEQLRALPHVARASLSADISVNLLWEGEIPAYFQTFYIGGGERYSAFYPFDEKDYLLLEKDAPEPPEAATLQEIISGERRMWDLAQEMYGAAEALGTDAKLVPLTLQVTDLEKMDLSKLTAAGEIDLAAIDAGEQVLACAPAWAVSKKGIFGLKTAFAPKERAASVENDAFFPGQTLRLAQLIGGGVLTGERNSETFRAAYAAMERRDAAVTVGAVVEVGGYGVCLLTTEKGFRALGLKMNGGQEVRITLDGKVDRAVEDDLTERIESVAMRGELAVTNYLKYTREEAEELGQVLLLFGGMTLLFFAVSVAMQVSAAGRRIRADSRMIGTLRAVGADEKTLLGCYRLPVLFSAALGTAIGCALYFWSIGAMWGGLRYAHPAALVPALIALGLLCALCCLLGVRSRLRQTLKQSIVENIREY